MGCASDTTWVDVIGGPADLTVSRCKVIPAKPKQEDLMTFQANVANIGGTDAYSFRMETYLDGELYDSGTLSLRAGESSQVSSERPWIAEGRPT
jgi:subtilase family serine protease